MALIYFANPSTDPIREAMSDPRLGAILTPRQRLAAPAGAIWCADNGCFGKDYVGDDKWVAWLQQLPFEKGLCRFAVAPDVVGDAIATLERSLPWLPRIREMGFAAALAAQDGLEYLRAPWDEFDVLFIGGSTDWKLGPAAADLAGEAVHRGKIVHMGRVNSKKRLRYAKSIGCTSADGTFIRFHPTGNLPRVLGWLDTVGSTPMPQLPHRPYRVEFLEDGEWVVWSNFVSQENAARKAEELSLLHETRVTCAHGCSPNACLL